MVLLSRNALVDVCTREVVVIATIRNAHVMVCGLGGGGSNVIHSSSTSVKYHISVDSLVSFFVCMMCYLSLSCPVC